MFWKSQPVDKHLVCREKGAICKLQMQMHTVQRLDST